MIQTDPNPEPTRKLLDWFKRRKTMEARIGYMQLEDSKVASNDALLDLVRMAPAEALKAKLIEVIQKNGLTWNQRTLVENVAEPVVLKSVGLGGPVAEPFPRDERDQT